MRSFTDIRNLTIEMYACRDHSEQCVQLLKAALDDGFRFTVEKMQDIWILAYIGNIEVIKFYFDREDTPAIHLMSILSNSYRALDRCLKVMEVCLDHPKFPKDLSEIKLHRILDVLKDKMPGDAGKCLVTKFLFQKYPQLIKSNGVFRFLTDPIFIYGISKQKNDAKMQILARETLRWICKHPEYPFLIPEDKVNDYSYLCNYPLYWAAKNNDEEIFKLFYFHKDTWPEARKKTVSLVWQHGNDALLEKITADLTKNQILKAILIYMVMMHADNPLLLNTRDIVLYLMQILKQVQYADCLASLQKGELPAVFIRRQERALCGVPKVSNVGFFPMVIEEGKFIDEVDDVSLRAGKR